MSRTDGQKIVFGGGSVWAHPKQRYVVVGTFNDSRKRKRIEENHR